MRAAVVLLSLALLCGFGFLASFEPGNGLMWKAFYGALTCGFLAGAVTWGGFAVKRLKGPNSVAPGTL